MFTNRKLVVLYGSQTGNSQDVAETIWLDSKRFYFNTFLSSLDDYDVLKLQSEACVIFICGTTGQGEEPDNMKQFWKFLLRKSLSKDSLISLKFAVLGLGDSSYAKFNFVAKRLHKRLLQLGGQPIINLGLADDQHDLGYDGVCDIWTQELWRNLLALYPLKEGIVPLPPNSIIIPRWKVTRQFSSLAQQPKSIYDPFRTRNQFNATVIDNERVTHPYHFQDVRLIKMAANDQEYIPGDVISLRPKNLKFQVEEFRALLREHKLDFDCNFKIESSGEEIAVPQVLSQEMSFQQLCEEYFDLMAVPRRHTFRILAQITDSELEKEKCLEFTTPEGQDDLYTYCNRPKRNIVEVLQDFPHATKNLTLEHLFEILPPIKTRDFSIASSCRQHSNEIHILLAVVKYKTKLVKQRFGLCSNYLADLKPGDTVTVNLKKGSFRFPQNRDIPVIMVGPGTGLAPFRNYIFDAVNEGVANKDTLLLFFGCRNESKDFYCKEDFEALTKERKLTLIPAFSRDQDNKIYVQHKILECRDLVWKFLQNGAYIFVAGNSKSMPQEVRNAFVEVCETMGNMNRDLADKVIKQMEKDNRYQTECWS